MVPVVNKCELCPYPIQMHWEMGHGGIDQISTIEIGVPVLCLLSFKVESRADSYDTKSSSGTYFSKFFYFVSKAK